ncbi:Fe-S cluster assembly protein dre2 like [Verticillium longisporum]|nr:Fe-S cluster assembly protein dre2 like [Verticillium longisporum]
MAPSFVTIDNTSDFDFTSPTTTTTQPFQNGASSRRSLLLAPPSVASHPSALAAVLASHPRATTDLQMLDRLSAGLITLPEATYDLILILSDADGSRAESTPLLLNNRALFGQVAEALRPGGQLRAQEGGSAGALTEVQALTREAVLSGLVADASGALAKPDYGDAGESVSLGLKFGKNKKSDAGPAVGAATAHMALTQWAEGSVDAEASVEARKVGNAKAWWRRGRCLQEMGRLEEAREWVRRGLGMEGEEAELVALLRDIETRIARGSKA